MEKLFTPDDVAKRYSVKKSTVWRWIRDKKLTASRIGRIYRITESALKDFEANSEEVK